jgi:hypothetical protein
MGIDFRKEGECLKRIVGSNLELPGQLRKFISEVCIDHYNEMVQETQDSECQYTPEYLIKHRLYFKEAMRVFDMLQELADRVKLQQPNSN